MKNLLHKYRHAWILCYAFIYIPWFVYLEKTVTSNYHIMHVRLDDFIPFNEYFIIPYMLWFAYVAGAVLYLFYRRERLLQALHHAVHRNDHQPAGMHHLPERNGFPSGGEPG